MRLGFFGGTFNPVHYGHVRAAAEVRDNMVLDTVYFIPSGTPPLKSDDLADAADRFAMTELAVAGMPGYAVSDIELVGQGKSFLVETVSRLRELWPRDRLFLIMGIDAFLDMRNWYQPAALVAMIDFLVMTRPGFALEDMKTSPFIAGAADDLPATWRLHGGKTATCVPVTPQPISSTLIRRLVREGKDISRLVPPAVAGYIAEKRLYRT